MMNQQSSEPPLSVKLIAICFVVAAVMGVFVLSNPLSYVWYIPSATLRVIANLLLIALFLYLGFGLWRLHEIARRISIGWYLYEPVCQLLGILSPSVRDAVGRTMQKTAAWLLEGANFTPVEASPSEITRNIIFGSIGAAIWSAVIIFFLIKRKTAFTVLVHSTQTQ